MNISKNRQIKTVACIGEVMIELVANADDIAKLGVAGDTFNTAVYLKRCLAEAPVEVAYVTALGVDPYSEKIFTTLQSHGLQTDHIERRQDLLPGLYAIHTDDHGERSFSYWRNASAARTLFAQPCEIDFDSLKDFDLIFASGISLAILPLETRSHFIDFIDEYRASGGLLAYDSNHRPRLWESVDTARRINEAMWSRADIALPSVDDEMALFGDKDAASVRDRLAGFGAIEGALKRGAEGPMDLKTGECYLPAEARVTVVDSTAAGDSFNAGYLAALISGRSIHEALQAGHDLAVKVIGQRGAIIDED